MTGTAMDRRNFLKTSMAVGAGIAAAAGLAGCAPQTKGEMSKTGARGNAPGEYDYEADVVIVGAGGAGLMAAERAHMDGASTLLLEKGAQTGGDTRLAEQDILAFWPEWTERNGYGADDYDEYLKDWIDTHGASCKGIRGEAPQDEHPFAEKFMHLWSEEVGPFLEQEIGLEFNACFSGQSLALSNTFEPRTYKCTKNIAGEVADHVTSFDDVELMLNTEVTNLIQDESGRVVGVTALDEDGNAFTAKANKGVVICTGTFNANPSMISRYLGNLYAECPTSGVLENTGDGIKMAQAIGAQLKDMDLGLNWFNPPLGYNTRLLIHNWQEQFGHGDAYIAPADPAICINLEGKRYMDELLGYNGQGRDTAAQPHKVGYYMCDSTLDTSWTEDCDYVLWADTLEELAAKMNVDPATLVQTVNTYNGYVDAGSDPDFNKDVSECTKIEKAPFYALMIVPQHYVTYGGLATDLETRVLDNADQPIPGLYAAGVVTGSYWEQEGLVYYGGEDQCLVYGWEAGRQAAAADPATDAATA